MNDQPSADKMDIYVADLENTVNGLTQIGKNLRKYAKDERDAHADYSMAKHKCLLKLFDEETKGKFKRTIAQREAIYRTEHEEERRKWTVAERAFRSEQSLLKGATAKIDALRTLISLEKAKMELR